jgi:uncharacterized protein
LRGIVLADTGPLYAARDPSDSYHGRAHDELARLRAQNLKVVVPYPILLESYSLVMRKLGNREAHALLAEVTSTSFLTNAVKEDYGTPPIRSSRTGTRISPCLIQCSPR